MRTLMFLILVMASFNSIAQSFYLFVGTYTDTNSKGIYVYRFNAATGKAELASHTIAVVNPSYLAIAPDKKHIYAVNETNTGSVSAFSIDHTTGRLTYINQQETGGGHPCYVAVDATNHWVIVGNYTGGNLAAFTVLPDGSLQKSSQLIQHTGSSVNAARQEKPHVHCTVFSPDQQHLLVADLGIDKVVTYKFDATNEKPLSPLPVSQAISAPGSGPRHLTFHPNQNFAYLIEELSGTIAVFKNNNGSLSFIERVKTHPEDYKDQPGSADIHVSPDGRFLYASNRGSENNIAIYSIDTNSGRLTHKAFVPSGGKTPRNFIIDPTGNYLLVANQNTNNIVVFKRDKQTGLLTKTGEELIVPKPVCLKIME